MRHHDHADVVGPAGPVPALGVIQPQLLLELKRVLPHLPPGLRDPDQTAQGKGGRPIAQEVWGWFLFFFRPLHQKLNLFMRRPAGRKRVQMRVAYGVRPDGQRRWLAFLRSQGESQAA